MSEGYVLMFGGCFTCRQPFSFNPNYVPSLRIDGVREPICPACMQQANAVRIKRGLEPHPIHPQAYEPLPEGELP